MPNFILLSQAGLLEMSLCGAVLVAITILLRMIAKNHLPKTAFIALWGIVLIRLLVPFNLLTPLSIYPNMSLPFQETATGIASYPIAANEEGEELSVSTMEQEIPQPNAITDYSQAESGFNHELAWDAVKGLLLMILWGIGIAGVSGYFLISMVRCRYMLATALPLEGHYEADCWLQGHTLHRKVRLYVSDQISTPLTYGTIHPKILLPKNMDFSDTKQLEFILAHELHHIQHFDTLWKLVSTIAVCIHWFNPMVWAMNYLLNQDLEFACDEAVLCRYGKASRQGYAMSLIQMAERNPFSSPLCNSFSKNTLEDRIRSIMQFHPFSAFAGALAVILVGGIATLFGTFPIGNQSIESAPYSISTPIETAVYTVSPEDVTVQVADHTVLPGTGTINMITLSDTDSVIEDIPESAVFSSGYSTNAIEAATSVIDIALQESMVGSVSGTASSPVTSSDTVTETHSSNGIFSVVEDIFDSIHQRSDLANSFQRYEKFGVKYNPLTEEITYQGQKVKTFADKKPGKESYQLYCERNKTGAINVVTVYNEKNHLIGLKEISDMQAQIEKDIHSIKKSIANQTIQNYSYDTVMDLYEKTSRNWEMLMEYPSEFDNDFIETNTGTLEELMKELEMVLNTL